MEFKDEWRKYEDEYQRSLVKNFDSLDSMVGGLYVNVEAWREAAVERLVAMGVEAVSPLVEVLTGEDAERRFWHLEERVFLSEKSYVLKAKAHAEKALKRIGEPGLSAVLSLLNDSKEAKVREAAARILSVIGAPAVDTLLVLLQRENSETRALAALALTGIEEERVVHALHDLLRREVEENRKRQRHSRYVWLTLLLVVYPLYFWKFYDWIPDPFNAFPVHILTMAGIAVLADNAQKVRRNIVAAMTSVKDIRMVGVLAACLFDKDKLVRQAAVKALKPVLLQMRASDQEKLSSGDMELLVKALSLKYETLVIALLKAFEQIGDDRALPAVERLAQKGRTEKIRDAAEACLPYLRVRAEEARQAKTLLRSAGLEESVASETLLRPAQGVVPVEESQLLRPS